MKMTAKIVIAWLAIFSPALLTNAAEAAEVEWLTDYEQARENAREVNRPILANFSGSDWCGWCIRLDREVFSHTEFKQYAREHLILFNADLPSGTELPATLTRQNQGLVRRFGVMGFPTVLLLEHDGTVIAQTGYRPGGAADYVEHLAESIGAHEAEVSGAESAAGATTPGEPKANEYDAENDRYWNADHGHWHPGQPPAGT